MTFTRDVTKSIRENIMTFFIDAFETMVEGVDGYSVTWHSIVREPLTKMDQSYKNAVSIMDVRERKEPEINYMRCHLTVAVEFAYRPRIGDNPSTELNRLLLDIQRRMRSDITAGNLALNVVETSSELDVESSEDRLVGGIVFWEVLYRHSIQDPRKLRGE